MASTPILRRCTSFRSELGETLGDALLRPHTPYYNQLKPVFGRVKGIAHVTGGGLIENVPRMLPDGLSGPGSITDSWASSPDLHARYKQDGFISRDEMYRVFNMGLGMVLACDPTRVSEVLKLVPEAVEVGEVVPGEGGARVML